MADVTYISPEIKMDGILDVTSAKGSTVVLAGHYKGEMRAVDVKLESGSTFNGKIFAQSTRKVWICKRKGVTRGYVFGMAVFIKTHRASRSKSYRFISMGPFGSVLAPLWDASGT